VRLILCRNNTIASWLLRFAMWSRWSHSAVWDPERGRVYDATLRYGVQWWPADEWFERYPHHEVRDRGPVQIEAMRAWLDGQVDKPYDWTAIVGFVLRGDWQAEDSWFCSELAETAFSLFGRPVFRADLSRVTPGHQDMVA